MPRRPKTIHGMTGTPTGRSWAGMMQRCYCRTFRFFDRYGGRGIKVCEFLRSTPVNLVMLIGLRPPAQSIDRADNNGHYSCGQCAECLQNNWPLNVKWSNASEQNRNKRDNRLVTVDGVTRCVTEWSEVLKIPRQVLFARLWRGGNFSSPYSPRGPLGTKWGCKQ